MNLKKTIEKKCSSFKGKSKIKCIENAKRTFKEKKAIKAQENKMDKRYTNQIIKNEKQIEKDTKKYGKSVANALDTIRFKQSKEGKKWATKGREKRRKATKYYSKSFRGGER